MTCKEYIEILDIYLEPHGNPQELVASVEEHMRLCPPCWEYWMSYRWVASARPAPPAIEIPEEARARLHATLDALMNLRGESS